MNIKTFIMQNKFIILLTAILSLTLLAYFSACKKYLDEKPTSSLATPSSIKDLQALLDQYTVINLNNPTSGEISADDYYLSQADWQALPENQQLMHIWERTDLFPTSLNDWFYLYRTIFIANTVLENAEKLIPSPERNNIMGQAYCWRAFSFQKAAFIWSLSYDAATATTALGIPLRLNTNFNEPSVRSSVEQTYQQIIDDFKKAVTLLPVIPLHVMRPSRPAAAAFLARTYLSMRNYDSVFNYADLSLQLKNNPQDYNDTRIVPSANFPFSTLKYDNVDILFHAAGSPTNALAVTKGRIDSTLYLSYHINDLRRTIFFRLINAGAYGFKGSYEGGNNLFGGISVSETLLMRAEAAARKGNKDLALADLNALLIKRFKTGTFQAVTAPDADAALEIILTERRKELLFRGLRWMDIKRLNLEGRNINLKRIINNIIYQLPANSPRFALPIPDDVIAISGMQQNPG
jgi:hypothetical protein